MFLNRDKSHFLNLSFNESLPDFFFFQRYYNSWKDATTGKILNIIILNKLNLKYHLKHICKMAYRKPRVLFNAKFNNLNLRGKIVNSSNNSQFSSCPLKWIFTSKVKIKQFIEDMRDDTFSILKTIHQHSVSVSLIEASRYLNNLSPEIINKTFYLRRTHRSLRSSNVFYSVKPRNKFLSNATVYQAIQKTSFRN